MNISLSKGGKDKKKKLGFGLNNRRSRDRSSKSANVFGADDDDDDDNNSSESDEGDGGRTAVNRQLRAEQEALRKRAAAALESSSSSRAATAAMYDYDGVYDEMHSSTTSHRSKVEEGPPEKKSRYVEDLLKAAKQRERERDVIHERKVAREQAQEDEEYKGKDKFVTRAYREKLAERQLWAQEEEAKRRQEEAQDVTKKTTGGAFASFYGNLNRNVAMGGGAMPQDVQTTAKAETRNKDAEDEHVDEAKASKTGPVGLGFLSGFEQAAPDEESKERNVDDPNETNVEAESSSVASMRKKREEKLAKARLRYFQRHGMTEESAANQKQQ